MLVPVPAFQAPSLVFHGEDVEIRSDESCRDARQRTLDHCSDETNHQQFLPVMNLQLCTLYRFENGFVIFMISLFDKLSIYSFPIWHH